MHDLINWRFAWVRPGYNDAEEQLVKIISWNVNGVRAILQRNVLYPFVATYDPDVLCLQEIKA